MFMFILQIGCAPSGWIKGELPSWSEDTAAPNAAAYEEESEEEEDGEEGEEGDEEEEALPATGQTWFIEGSFSEDDPYIIGGFLGIQSAQYTCEVEWRFQFAASTGCSFCSASYDLSVVGMPDAYESEGCSSFGIDLTAASNPITGIGFSDTALYIKKDAGWIESAIDGEYDSSEQHFYGEYDRVE